MTPMERREATKQRELAAFRSWIADRAELPRRIGSNLVDLAGHALDSDPAPDGEPCPVVPITTARGYARAQVTFVPGYFDGDEAA